ncbi:MAG: zinc ABC transporter substrate-binding protein [Chloroflexi bacterium]|nr:zinc ABC transporter substrate-binding protein [Chloroflexota bacterium]
MRAPLRSLVSLAAALLLIAAIAPARPGAAASEPAAQPAPRHLNIVATNTIIADMARQVGGDRVSVRSLLAANTDPHEYEPGAADAAIIAEADMVLLNGLGLEHWMSRLLTNVGRDVPVNVLSRDIAIRHGDEGEEGDPHIWQNPLNAKRMAENIRDGYVYLDPDGAAMYHAWTNAYLAELDALDGWVAERIAEIPPQRRKMVTNHDAFGYYLDRYGITLVGSIMPSFAPGTEPSARDIAELIEKIRAEEVPAIFAENTLNPKLATQIARDAGVQIVTDLYTDALGAPGGSAGTYVDMIRYNTVRIAVALR